uniref:Uncharacterized protein n=1 Tax=Mucochytrium quahogii TaxID=96639 RepID=A0A7S2SA95_9STRA
MTRWCHSCSPIPLVPSSVTLRDSTPLFMSELLESIDFPGLQQCKSQPLQDSLLVSWGSQCRSYSIHYHQKKDFRNAVLNFSPLTMNPSTPLITRTHRGNRVKIFKPPLVCTSQLIHMLQRESGL